MVFVLAGLQIRIRDPVLFLPRDPRILSTLDPGWKKSDLESGRKIPDPQHYVLGYVVLNTGVLRLV
jgi:hypothetical protein